MPSLCDIGTYNTKEKQTHCSECPAAYWCGAFGIVDLFVISSSGRVGLDNCSALSGIQLDWMNVLGNAGVERLGSRGSRSVVYDTTGNLIIAGRSNSSSNDFKSKGGYDVFLAKYDDAGNRIWIHSFGTESDDYFDD